MGPVHRLLRPLMLGTTGATSGGDRHRVSGAGAEGGARLGPGAGVPGHVLLALPGPPLPPLLAQGGRGAGTDGHPDLDRLDLGSIGWWDERHLSGSMTCKLPTPENRRKVVDAYLTAFTKTPPVMLLKWQECTPTPPVMAPGGGPTRWVTWAASRSPGTT